MRVVVDTNVLVSAVIRPAGSLGRVLKHLRDADYTLLYSHTLLTELVDVLMRPAIQAKYALVSPGPCDQRAPWDAPRNAAHCFGTGHSQGVEQYSYDVRDFPCLC